MYTYTPLAPGEIRLLTLHPGSEGSPVRISLDNTQLHPSKQAETTCQLSLRELQKTLPAGWTVYQTLGGRNIFEHEDTEITSWSHPEQDFDKALYKEAVTISSTDAAPSFEALSYTWGVEDESIEVDVIQQQNLSGAGTKSTYDTSSHPWRAHENFNTLRFANRTALSAPGGSRGTLLIRPNLCTALQHLRSADRCRTIWIDAVCINQCDVQERNEQVRRMADVYRSATRVIIWVGTAADDSSLALSSLEYLAQQLEWTRDNFALCHPDAVHRDWFRSKTTLPFNDTIWRAFESLLQRPWFERLWIWQEVHLASRDSILQCGNDCIEWTLLRRAVRRLYTAISRRPLHFSLNFRSRLDRVDALVRNHNGVSFPRWIEIARKALCTDTRDRVYGLLGLAPPEYANVLKPDYTLPVHEV